VNLVARGPWRVMRSDIGLHNLKQLWKGIVEHMMCVLGRSGLRVVSSCLVSGVGCEVLLEQVQLNFNFRNKFIILLPYGLLVDNNTF